MREKQLDQDFTGVTGGTDDTDFHGRRGRGHGRRKNSEAKKPEAAEQDRRIDRGFLAAESKLIGKCSEQMEFGEFCRHKKKAGRCVRSAFCDK
jgi:hypothetical protein